ncbi:hypothetical protein [Bacillus thuringiensis]|nr:hypothetical protein [Bacillus thuringiensis]
MLVETEVQELPKIKELREDTYKAIEYMKTASEKYAKKIKHEAKK